MGAAALLQHLRDAGLMLTLTSAGGLHVAPRDALTDYLRLSIRASKTDLLALLEAERAADAEAFDERATSLGFDCGRSCREAEPAALAPLEHGKVSATPAQTCASCRHFGKRRTCLEPVAAGLLTQAQGFGIVWPPEGHAPACLAYTDKMIVAWPFDPELTTSDHTKLMEHTISRGSEAHSQCWGQGIHGVQLQRRAA